MARFRESIIRLSVLCTALSALQASGAQDPCNGTYYPSITITILDTGLVDKDPACVTTAATVTFTTGNGTFATFFKGASPFIDGHPVHATGIYQTDTIDKSQAGATTTYKSCFFGSEVKCSPDPKIIVRPDNIEVFPTIVNFIGHESVRDVAIVNVGKTAMKVEITPPGEKLFLVDDSGCRTLAAGQACIVKITRTPSNAEGETRKFTVTYTGGSKTITVHGPGK